MALDARWFCEEAQQLTDFMYVVVGDRKPCGACFETTNQGVVGSNPAGRARTYKGLGNTELFSFLHCDQNVPNTFRFVLIAD